MQHDKNRKGPVGQEKTDQNKNSTLQDPGASVADYGRSGHLSGEAAGNDRSEERGGKHGASRRPIDEDDTLGNP